ncbi:MAG: hypothetical protein ACI8S6_000710 [Myxococcota bacterium]|jgi:uncharacterized protein (DUF58 family)
MIPTPRGLRALAGWLTLGVLAVIWPALGPLWGGAGLALATALFLDGLSLRTSPTPDVTRRMPGSLAVGRWSEATLRLSSPAGRPLAVEVFDLHPDSFEVEVLPAMARLPAAGWADVPLRLRPSRRGRFTFPGVELRISGRLGLLSEQRAVDCGAEVKVYPDFKVIARYALLAGEDRTAQLGIHLQRRRGEGQDFHQLREYRQGDPSRAIDWKATSRRRQLISREYREERDQQVVILLDCGRRMRAHDGGLSHFDQALNAALLLSHVALRQGDAVGLQAFSGQNRWLPPIKGRGGINRLLNGVFDLHPTTEPADFIAAASALLARQRRRALVVLLTNLRDDDSDELAAAVASLRRRHLLVVASLREVALREAYQAPIGGLPDALRAAAALRYLRERSGAHDALRARGVTTLDVEPPELPAALVNAYLQIKRSGAL